MNYKSTSHFLHLILTIIFLPWGLVWIWRAMSNAQHNRQIEIQLMQSQLEEMKRNNWRK